MPPEQSSALLFEVHSVLGRRIRTTHEYWQKIIRDKHPAMQDKIDQVQKTLINPLEVRRSKSDFSVYLYYRRYGKRFICVVTRHENSEGFVITTYISDNMKEGEVIWRRSE